jgi:two-component system cell cycle response regulator CpdR
VGDHWIEEDRPVVTDPEEDDPGMADSKVLLVDDEPSILSVLHWALQDLGCRVTSAPGGEAALDKLCNETFDILVTDLIMPDLDGFFLMKMANKLDPQMKIIVMTGSPELVPSIFATGSRMDGVLVKPFGLNGLKSAIQKCSDAAH